MRSLPLAIALLLSSAPGARAQRFFSGFYGTSRTYTSALHVTIPSSGTDATFSGVHWRNNPGQPTLYYAASVGEWRGRVGFELDFTHNKALAQPEYGVGASGTWKGQPLSGVHPLGDYVQEARFTNGHNIVAVDALYRGAGRDARFQPYIGAGPTYTVVWSRNLVDGQRRFSHYHGAGFGASVKAGVRLKLRERLFVAAETKLTRGPAEAATTPNGSLKTYLTTWHQLVGISTDL